MYPWPSFWRIRGVSCAVWSLTCRIKGQNFTLRSLLLGSSASQLESKTSSSDATSHVNAQTSQADDKVFEEIINDPKCAIAIARLAPQDYHRFHSPVEGTVVAIKDIHGKLFSLCFTHRLYWIHKPGIELTSRRAVQ